MKIKDALPQVAGLASSQWGLLTTAQARSAGLSRLDVARLAQAGHLERLAHGVYRVAGAPSDEYEDIRVAWLSLEPGRLAGERLGDPAAGAVVSGATAAWLHGLGDLQPAPYELTSADRLQTQRSGLRLRQRDVPGSSVTIARGLPVTTVEQTIADLVEQRTDLSLVADVLRDAVASGRVNLGALAVLLEPLAARLGHLRNDGSALLDRLMKIAGLDEESVADRVAASPIGELVTGKILERLTNLHATPPSAGWREAVASANRHIARQAASISVALTPLDAAIIALSRQWDALDAGLASPADMDETPARLRRQTARRAETMTRER